MSRKDLLFRFLGDTKSLEKATATAERSMGGLEGQTGRTGGAIGSMKKAAIGLGSVLAVGQLAKGIGSAISRAEEMDSKYAITTQIIESTGGAAGLSATQIQQMSKEMAMTTGLDKSVATEAANVLLTFTNIKGAVGEANDVFGRAHDITADMATVFGGSAVDASKQLGKALNDPIGGVSALSRVGVQFTDQQKEQIRTLVESGDVLGAQKIILNELETQVGGTAEASADATAIMARGFDELTEAIGMELLPIVQKIAPALGDMAAGVGGSISNFGVGVQAADRFASKIGDMIGPIFGMSKAWTEADENLYNLDRTMAHAHQRLTDGIPATQVAAEWMAHLSDKGSLTDDTFKRVQESLGLSNDQMVTARDVAREHADALGFTADELATLDDLTATYARESLQAATRAEEDFAEGARDAAGAMMDAARNTDDMAEAVVNVADEMKKLTDPVYAAERSVKAYEEALEDANADGVVTADEALTITQRFGDMQTSIDDLSPANMLAMRDAMVAAMGITADQAQALIDQLHLVNNVQINPGIASLDAFVARVEAVAGKRIQFDFSNMQFATQAQIEREIEHAVGRLARKGVIVPL